MQPVTVPMFSPLKFHPTATFDSVQSEDAQGRRSVC